MNFRRLLLWLLLVVAVVLGLFRLRLDVEVLNLLPQDSYVVQGLRLYQQSFSNARQLFITIRADTPESAETAARNIATQLRHETNLVASVVWQPPWLESPAQASELLGYLWLNQPPAFVQELTNRLSAEHLNDTLAEARDALSTSLSPRDVALGGYDPLGLSHLPESSASSAFGNGDNFFVSADGRYRIIFVEARGELRNYRACRNWLEAVQKVVATADIPSHTAVKYTGGPAFVAEIAGGMEHDMTESVGLTAVIIAILFWLAHRRIAPMLWLLFLLGAILVCTIALSGLLFGTLNVVSLGFAGILLGLAVDYGVVHYQEALAKPRATVPQIRRAIRPSITWAAITTISAFLVLNLGGMPGLGQLGTTVAIGVALSAFVMLFVFLPPLFRDRARFAADHEIPDEPPLSPEPLGKHRRNLAVGGSVFLLVVCLGVLVTFPPSLDHSPDALRPLHSKTYAALDEMKVQLGRADEPLWLIIRGHNEAEVAQRLATVESALDHAKTNGWVSNFLVPSAIWPQPDRQQVNKAAVASLLQRRDDLHAAILANDFTTNSLFLADNVFATWRRAVSSTDVFWPTNFVSRWILDNVTSRSTNSLLAMALVYPKTNDVVATDRFVAYMQGSVVNENILLSGWSLLGSDMFERVQRRFPALVIPMLILVSMSLWLAFRRAKEIILSVAVLSLSGLCLLAIMSVAGWKFNLMNLMAVPLILGAGVDYSIFMQLALRRHNGNLRASHHAVGRALLLCGGTAVTGFASLALSSNAGMASLGLVCAIGIGLNMVISVYVLPIWWRSSGNDAKSASL